MILFRLPFVDNNTITSLKNLFAKYENCNDTEEDGFDMDTVCAILEAENSDESDDDFDDNYEPDSEEEALESETEEEKPQMSIVAYGELPREQQYQALCTQYDPQYLEQIQQMYIERMKELSHLNLSFFNL